MAFTVVQKLDKDPKDITPDYTLDTLGEPCPYPAIVMLETMPQLQKGEILELLSDCAQSINNIPVDTKNHGYTLLSVEQDGTKFQVVGCRSKCGQNWPHFFYKILVCYAKYKHILIINF